MNALHLASVLDNKNDFQHPMVVGKLTVECMRFAML